MIASESVDDDALEPVRGLAAGVHLQLWHFQVNLRSPSFLQPPSVMPAQGKSNCASQAVHVTPSLDSTKQRLHVNIMNDLEEHAKVWETHSSGQNIAKNWQ